MRMRFFLVPLAVAVMLCPGACGKKPTVQSELSNLEKAFPAAPPPAPAQPDPANVNPPKETEAHELVRAAVVAAQAKDYANGVIALDEAQRKPGLTAEQVMSAQRTKQAMKTELLQRAANGDQQALAQLKAIEKTRSQ